MHESAQLTVPLYWWLGTLIWFAVLLLGDLYLNSRSHRRQSIKRAAIRSCVWISLGVLLGGVIWLRFGADAGTKYFAGFVVEKSLSVDNIFVWGLLLSYLSVPLKYHYKVLFWGIFGAIIFRSIFVFSGIELIHKFEPTLIVLGGILLFSAYKLIKDGDGFAPEKSRIIYYAKKILPVSNRPYNGKFFAHENGRFVVTLLFFAIVCIELTDLLFAVDSVPAVLAIVRDPYLVLASNIAAILGLRALYFVFEALEGRFWLLNKALAVILAGVGITLFLEPDSLFGMRWFNVHIPTWFSLVFVAVMLAIGMGGSLIARKPPVRTKQV